MKFIKHPLNIIYLNIAEKGPSGGSKVIYRHSNLINDLKIPNVSSEILHIKKRKISKWNNSLKKMFNMENRRFFGWNTQDITIPKDFIPQWTINKIKLKENFIFKKEKDFVIFPEIFAHFAKNLCIENKIDYAIFVQNGYCLRSTNDYKTLNEVYKNSKFILSNSNDSSKCVVSAFDNCKHKILKLNLSIDSKKFNSKTKKSNVITYMPRKLPAHSENLIFFLRNNLPNYWKFKALHNLNEKEVFNNLSKSKIFLSFSEMEGLGLPPIEAAIAGNKVIGYSGSGGKEYWKKPIFTEIPHGNINKFIKEVMVSVNNKKLSNKLKPARKKIIKQFAPIREKKNLIKMIKLIHSTK